jgi:N-acetylmuramoyl-L-alanine amidase
MNESESPSTSGVECIYSTRVPAREAQAKFIAERFAKYAGVKLRPRPALPDNETPQGMPKPNGNEGLPILRDTTPPAFLLEMGFISNERDVRTVRTKGATALLQVIRDINAEGVV